MRLLLVLAVSLSLIATARAAPLPTDDPERSANEIFTLISQSQFRDVASKLSEAVGQPDSAPKLRRKFKAFEGRKFDFGKKVYDKDYAGALRQIIYVAYVEKTGFIYFRFTYKMTSRGWYLTNFLFKEGGQELFPQGFIEGPG